MITNWGYNITGEGLEDLLTVEQFNQITANKYSGDVRISPNIKSASQAVRNYCGWHVYPNIECTFIASFYDKRVARVGGGMQIQLPSTFVTSITSLTIGGVAYTNYILETNGILRVLNITDITPYSTIEVIYQAGIDDNLVSAVQDIIAYRVTHALASSNGVTSESAGGMSITYNANWINSARSTALPDDNKEVLQPYRLQGVY
jgi:hypothetical protein